MGSISVEALEKDNNFIDIDVQSVVQVGCGGVGESGTPSRR